MAKSLTPKQGAKERAALRALMAKYPQMVERGFRMLDVLSNLLDAADECDRLRAELAVVVRKADHGCYGHCCNVCDY
jgi:hypothetical protein